MNSLAEKLVLDSQIEVLLVEHVRVVGQLRQIHEQWLEIEGCSGRLLIAKDKIILIALQGSLPMEQPAKTARVPRRRSPADFNVPDPTVLKRSVDALLDGADMHQLAALTGLQRRQVQYLRQAFECLRGNANEEALPASAQPLLNALRQALQPED